MRHVIVTLLTLTAATAAAEDIPDYVTKFTRQYCTECHGSAQPKGDFRIDRLSWDLRDGPVRDRWDLVRDYVAHGDMPPTGAPDQPDAATVEEFIGRVEADFARADTTAQPGGTPLRRLNRIEYLNTVRDLFGIRMIKLPPSFPQDATDAQFDTMPEGLFLSPALMEGYYEVATDIANRMVPLPGPKRYRSDYTAEKIGGDRNRRWFGPGKEFLQFTGVNGAGWGGALWDPLLVAPESGVYRVRMLANAQADTGADGKPLRLTFHAFDPTEEQLAKRYLRKWATKVAEINVPAGQPTWIECDVPLEAGETFHIYCDNRFAQGDYPDGGMTKSQVNRAVRRAKKSNAPTVELRRLQVRGPVAVLPRVRKFFGAWPPALNRAELNRVLLPLAAKAYRRPPTEAEKDELIAAVLQHGRSAGDPRFGWHYAIRRILCSPNFLYREAAPAREDGRLDDFTLASRLSYFLWSTMPDAKLVELAQAGRLSAPKVLAAQVRRMLDHPKSEQFVKHFAGQWLGNRGVSSINICDNRYKWHETVRYGFVRSTEMFFEEVLRDNLPVATFIDSDFTYANNAMLVVWGVADSGRLGGIARVQRHTLIWPEPERIDLTTLDKSFPDHVQRRGGLLGLPGVLTVTGDGVESSPILRGVWVLENLFGDPPPPPPEDVPALDIDTSQAATVRESLAAHQNVVSCASCHREIDPLGLALENYDAIGGWRESYVEAKLPINASATMPDGTALSGPQSIKDYLLANPDIFTRCLLTKLLEYGTGRELSVGDQPVVEEIVRSAPKTGYRFQDLIVKAATSGIFRAK